MKLKKRAHRCARLELSKTRSRNSMIGSAPVLRCLMVRAGRSGVGNVSIPSGHGHSSLSDVLHLLVVRLEDAIRVGMQCWPELAIAKTKRTSQLNRHEAVPTKAKHKSTSAAGGGNVGCQPGRPRCHVWVHAIVAAMRWAVRQQKDCSYSTSGTDKHGRFMLPVRNRLSTLDTDKAGHEFRARFQRRSNNNRRLLDEVHSRHNRMGGGNFLRTGQRDHWGLLCMDGSES